MLDYAKVRNWQSGEVRHAYTQKDVQLYALGVGMAQDPMDREELRYVIEGDGLRVLPSMAAVLASPGFWMRNNPEVGIDHVRLVHGEQSVTLHRPLPAGGTLVGVTRVTRVVDKGAGKGALVHSEKTLTDAASGALVATCASVTFCRGDGGFSANGGGDPPGEQPRATPERAPELALDFPTRPEAALVYRLSGDINPLHSDPDVAAKAGFPRPILHGLATYGAACHGLVKAYCGYDPARLKSISARFSSPTYPGDVIRLECWKEGDEIAFRARVPAREVTVLSHGRALCAPA
ncbi:MAG: MaoC family dehydratase N-terminal domain-containing protein [Burkholderiales bacterium]|nr:MaoC family dehydratase N-terminal domain-containing protein [Burkholderiales bacterium]